MAPCILWIPANATGGPARTVMGRCRRWLAGNYASLWDDYMAEYNRRALEQGLHAAPPDEARFAVSYDELDCAPHLQARGDTEASADSITQPTLRRALTAARHGYMGRAAATLSAARFANADEATRAALQLLHPTEPDPAALAAAVRAARALHVSPPDFTTRQVRAAVRSFPLGSTCGPSGLSPRHLCAAISTPGRAGAEAVKTLVNLVASGRVPMEVRPWFFGGRLAAICKEPPKDAPPPPPPGPLRPIAVGEVLRRLAGKLLVRHVARDMCRLLLGHSQVGVAVRGGADAAALAARAASNSFLAAAEALDATGELPASFLGDECAVKTDMKNAFNSLHRADMMWAVIRLCPALAAYCEACYGADTFLIFRGFVIISSSGVQQGDPAGPLFFALTLAVARWALPLRERGC